MEWLISKPQWTAVPWTFAQLSRLGRALPLGFSAVPVPHLAVNALSLSPPLGCSIPVLRASLSPSLFKCHAPPTSLCPFSVFPPLHFSCTLVLCPHALAQTAAERLAWLSSSVSVTAPLMHQDSVEITTCNLILSVPFLQAFSWLPQQIAWLIDSWHAWRHTTSPAYLSTQIRCLLLGFTYWTTCSGSSQRVTRAPSQLHLSSCHMFLSSDACSEMGLALLELPSIQVSALLGHVPHVVASLCPSLSQRCCHVPAPLPQPAEHS